MFCNFTIHNYNKKRTLLRGKENIFFFNENYPNCIAVSTISNKQFAIKNIEITKGFSLAISMPNLIAQAIVAIPANINLVINKQLVLPATVKIMYTKSATIPTILQIFKMLRFFSSIIKSSSNSFIVV